MTTDLPSDDASLIRSLQTGTPEEANEAFSHLVLRHTSRLFMHLSKKGLASDEQQDVAQETWIRVWRKICQFEDRGIELFSWVRKIADNVAREHFRAKFFREQREPLGEATDIAESDHILSVRHDSPSAYEILTVHEFREVAQQLLEEARKDYKEVIEARYFVELSPDEIAELYGWSRAKVYTTHYRAIGWLKVRLQERYGTQD